LFISDGVAPTRLFLFVSDGVAPTPHLFLFISDGIYHFEGQIARRAQPNGTRWFETCRLIGILLICTGRLILNPPPPRKTNPPPHPTYYHVQYRSNVSDHFSSRFSRDAYRFSRDVSRFSRDGSRFSRDGSRFARESLKHLVWNILYMYYS